MLVSAGRVRFTRHARERMVEQTALVDDVIEAIRMATDCASQPDGKLGSASSLPEGVDRLDRLIDDAPYADHFVRVVTGTGCSCCTPGSCRRRRT